MCRRYRGLWEVVFSAYVVCRYIQKAGAEMTLKEKGEWNLKLAEILDSEEFLDLLQFHKEHSQIRREHLCSVIINRLYYGVYLIAKGKLVDKGICKPKDRVLHSGEGCIWEKLENASCFNEIDLANQLRNLRNCADYQEDNINNADNINRAKKIAQRLHKTLEGLK